MLEQHDMMWVSGRAPVIDVIFSTKFFLSRMQPLWVRTRPQLLPEQSQRALPDRLAIGPLLAALQGCSEASAAFQQQAALQQNDTVGAWRQIRRICCSTHR